MYISLENAYKMSAILLDSMAALVALMLFVSLAHRTYTRQERIFRAMLLINFAALGCDLITWLTEGIAPAPLLYTANFMVFGLGYVLTAMFTQYLSCYITVRHRGDRWFLPIIYSSCIAALALTVLSLFNHMYFYVENDRLASGPLSWLSVAYSAALILLNMVLVWLHRKELGRRNTGAFFSYGVFLIVSAFIQFLGTELTVTWIGATLTLLLIYLVVHVDYVNQLRKQELELAEHRSMLILSQIQPHFLYNTLNSIYHLCDQDAKQAQRAVGEFSEYLRENLIAINQTEPVPFLNELTHVKHYLVLEQMRFEDALRVVYDIRETSFLLPPLSVQVLVENAVKHGFGGSAAPVTIRIAAQAQEDCYQVVVQDDGAGFDAALAEQDAGETLSAPASGGTHMGLKILKLRLEAMCGGTLELTSSPGNGTTAIIRIPREKRG